MAANLLFFFLACSFSFSLTRDDSAAVPNAIEPRENYIYELDQWSVRATAGDTKETNVDNDSAWIDLSDYTAPSAQGIWWARTSVTISSPLPENRYFALYPDRIVSAFEVYWDGVYIGSNGIVGQGAEKERVGKYFALFQIPRELTTVGRHSILLRVSNFHLNSQWQHGQFFFGYYDSIIKLIYAWQIRIYFLLGMVFLALCLNVFLFFTSHGRAMHLLFALLCLVMFLSHLANYYWAIVDVSNHYLDFRNLAVPITVMLIGIALPVFFLYEFSFPSKRIAAGFVVCANLAVLHWTSDSADLHKHVFAVLFVSILILALWALYRKKQGSLPIILGIALSGLISILNFRFGIDHLTIFGSTIILCYTYILAKEFALSEKAKQEALVRSIRLENQLLKRSISPHFLLNSLTSVIVWLKREPATAVKLVESLSKEFRLISQIAGLEKVALKTEIELCETHLRIMSYRRNSRFTLDYHEVDLEEEIPPMILHTLIENGITHGFEGCNEGRFVLRQRIVPGGIHYSLFNSGGTIGEAGSKADGTGYKYIRARLEETYQGNWAFNFGEVEGGFEVNFTLYPGKRHP